MSSLHYTYNIILIYYINLAADFINNYLLFETYLNKLCNTGFVSVDDTCKDTFYTDLKSHFCLIITKYIQIWFIQDKDVKNACN